MHASTMMYLVKHKKKPINSYSGPQNFTSKVYTYENLSDVLYTKALPEKLSN